MPAPDVGGTAAGWAVPVQSARKFHYFPTRARSLCRRYAAFGVELQADTGPSPDDCAVCRRKFDAIR